ncbi:MAG: haloalkane dehalogenase, partial [Pontixanthobacter sp.]
MTTIHRTPDSQFAGLRDYPFAPHYFETNDGLRMHYCDEGPRNAPVMLMMHGEPSWSYLYRKMIGPVADVGYRVLAPDLIGFGKSDKPIDTQAYSYAGQVAWIREWFDAMDISDVVLVCQDWGSLIGLRLLAETPDRFAAVVLSNGGLPTGQTPPPAFAAWREFSKNSPEFAIGSIIQGGVSLE